MALRKREKLGNLIENMALLNIEIEKIRGEASGLMRFSQISRKQGFVTNKEANDQNEGLNLAARTNAIKQEVIELSTVVKEYKWELDELDKSIASNDSNLSAATFKEHDDKINNICQKYNIAVKKTNVAQQTNRKATAILEDARELYSEVENKLIELAPFTKIKTEQEPQEPPKKINKVKKQLGSGIIPIHDRIESEK